MHVLSVAVIQYILQTVTSIIMHSMQIHGLLRQYMSSVWQWYNTSYRQFHQSVCIVCRYMAYSDNACSQFDIDTTHLASLCIVWRYITYSGNICPQYVSDTANLTSVCTVWRYVHGLHSQYMFLVMQWYNPSYNHYA